MLSSLDGRHGARKRGPTAIAAAGDADALEELRVRFLGRKSELKLRCARFAIGRPDDAQRPANGDRDAAHRTRGQLVAAAEEDGGRSTQRFPASGLSAAAST